jgi:tyrosine decarboxylase/aspartate 1-decarboxylase
VLFRSRGFNIVRIKKRLFDIRREYSKKDVENNFGWLSTPPNPLAIWAYRYFLDINPNHLGNWSIQKSKPLGTQQLEREIISMLINLYHGRKQNLEGYITSGGTEGNLYSLWTGKKYLTSQTNNKPICLIRTDLTHYSIRKCADITGIEDYITPLNVKYWNMDARGLMKTINQLYLKGYRGFLIPLTLGYTQTGTSDHIEKMLETVTQLNKMYKDSHYYLWIDAALNGLIKPFLDSNFSPFSNKLIQSFVVDFHKFGGAPYPAGVVLYRKHLRINIEKSIDYLPEMDSTVLGSRPGATVIAIWSIIIALGKEGFKRKIENQITNKNFFIYKIQKIISKCRIISDTQSLTCGIIFPSKFNPISQFLKNKYGLFSKKIIYKFTENISWTGRVYKIYFLPHINKNKINELLNDLKNFRRE